MKKHLVLSLLLIIFLVNRSSSDVRPIPAPYHSEEERELWNERNRKFAQLYLSRFERNVAKEILPFALKRTDQNADLRSRAIIALGRIEDPLAEAPLQKLLDQLELQAETRPETTVPVDAISLFRLKLAIGRIRARDLKGKEKLEAISQSIGLTWDKVQEMGDRLKEPTSHRLLMGSYQLEVVEEFIDILRSMRRKGENLNPIETSRLLYSPLLEPLLSSAQLTRLEEAEFWLKRSSAPSNLVFDPALVAGLGNEIKPLLLKYLQAELQKAKDQPQLFHAEKYGIVSLNRMFEAAAATGDLQFVPVLKSFVESDDLDIKGHAFRSLNLLESGEGTMILPARSLSGI